MIHSVSWVRKTKFYKNIQSMHLLTLLLAKPLIKAAKTSAQKNEGDKKIDIKSGEQVEKPVHSTMTISIMAIILSSFPLSLLKGSFPSSSRLYSISLLLFIFLLCFLTIERSTYHAKNKSSSVGPEINSGKRIGARGD